MFKKTKDSNVFSIKIGFNKKALAKLLKSAVPYASVIILALFLSAIMEIAYAWTPPSQSPPEGNTSAPINVSNTAQSKIGNLSIGSGLKYWLTQIGNSFALKNNDGLVKFILGQDGHVGIGTDAPAKLVHLQGSGTGNDIARLLIASSDNQASIQLNSNNSGQAVIYSPADTDDLGFLAGSSPAIRMMIKGDTGNIGINTTAPAQKLDVNGYVRGSTGLCIADDCRTSWPSDSGGGPDNDWQVKSDNNMYSIPSGNVGIGVASPVQKLDVMGYVRGRDGLCIADNCKAAWPLSTTELKDSGWISGGPNDNQKSATVNCLDGYTRVGCSGSYEQNCSSGDYGLTHYYLEPSASQGCTINVAQSANGDCGILKVKVFAICSIR